MDQLYLCRHGETAWSLSGQHTGRTDIGLTERGKAQARLLREKLQGIPFTKILTSPLQRSLATCEGMGASQEDLLTEWDYGDYEGLTSREIRQQKPAWNLFQDGAPGGETVEQVGNRADQLLKSLQAYEGKICLFSHGHFLRVLAARFLGLEPPMGKLFFVSVASLSILGHERAQPVVVGWNQTFAQ